MSSTQRGGSLLAVWIGIVLLAGGAIWWFGRGKTAPPPPPPPADVTSQTGTHALLVGCSEYPAMKARFLAHYESKIQLLGPERDVALMASTLRDYLGVPESQITRLAGHRAADPTSNPTRENILAALQRAAEEVPAGGRFIFFYAGHGTQQKDTTPPGIPADVESDGQDEVILASDADSPFAEEQGLPGVITDDELRHALGKVRSKGATVWAIFDCCHAGTLTRGPGVRVRQLDRAALGLPEPTGAASRGAKPPGGLAPEDMTGMAAFYAVRSSQRAPEMKLPRDRRISNRSHHGLLTWMLVRALRRVRGAPTFRMLAHEIDAAYRAMPWTSVQPHAEGDLDMPVRTAGVDGERPWLLTRTGPGAWTLDAGHLEGIQAGDRLEVFRPGDTAGAALGHVQVQRTEPDRATCVSMPEAPLSATDADRSLLSARMHTRAPTVQPLTVSVLDADDRWIARPAWPENLAARLPQDAAGLRHVTFPAPSAAGSEDPADWALRLVEPTRWVLQRCEPGWGAPGVACTPEDVATALARVRRAEALRALSQHAVAAGLPPGLTIETRLEDGDEILQDGTTLVPGTAYRVHMTNRTNRAWDVTLLKVDANHGISVLFPLAQIRQSARIESRDNQTTRSARLVASDDAVGHDLLLAIALPRRGAVAQSLAYLAQESLPTARGAGVDPAVSAFLDDLAFSKVSSRGAPIAADALRVSTVGSFVGWGPLALPEDLHTQGAETGYAAVRPPAPSGSEFGPTWIGTHDQLLTGREDASDAWVTWSSGGSLAIHVDTRGDLALGTRDRAWIRDAVSAGRLQAGLVVQVGPKQRVAWYDHRIALVESTGDERAERRWEATGSTATSAPSWAPWLSTAHLTLEGSDRTRWQARKRVMATLRPFARR